ncbi:hypothetical protein MOSE0_L05666 [Monosporozyma servazzii]
MGEVDEPRRRERDEHDEVVTKNRRIIRVLEEQLDAANEEIRRVKRSHRGHEDTPTI